ncbi:Lactonase family protein [Rhodovastum atsumiense]|uniref:Lactonase family protein n=1 Tax=Rhodovastum atsumiense TaxID=504468 RepID=A0A5M6IR10_9PROT|nr:lactonase family protein [Rhodovastum atsumiense]KAA5610387.1 lactonase family protein [Rhodovastum atsumiense]CAH2602935.1 Lactonase family protein [Rhodovastum atsumiense]
MNIICFVACAEVREIDVFRLDQASGTLGRIGAFAVPGTDSPSPSLPLAISPDGRILYAALRSPPFPVASFAIDASTGGLHLLDTARLPESMPWIATDRGGRHLLAASYGGNLLAVLPIGTQGVVRTPARQVIPQPGHLHCLLTDPTNHHAYATLISGDRILHYHFDAGAGRLSPATPDGIATAPGTNPRHLCFGRDGSVLYAVNDTGGSISAYAVDPASGDLREIQTIPLLPSGAQAAPAAADIHLTPDGRFLYASERANNLLAAFRVDPASGQLEMTGTVAAPTGPRGFAIEPGGRFLLCAGQQSHSVVSYAIDPQTGELSRRAETATGGNPNWIETVILGS